MKDGFKASFLEPVEDPGDVKLIRYTFKYHQGYGSPQVDKKDVKFEVKRLSEREFQFALTEPLLKDYCYEFSFPGAEHSMVCYTVREIPE